MPITITPQVFEDLMLLALHWQWQRALEKQHSADSRFISPIITGYTTVDKIVRILHGLKILTDKQRKVLYKDRRTQSLVLMHCEKIAPGDFRIDSLLETTRKIFLLRCDLACDLNRERMLRDMAFFVTAAGSQKAQVLEERYKSVVTRATYDAEVKRQEELKPKTEAGQGAMMQRYQRRVGEETS